MASKYDIAKIQAAYEAAYLAANHKPCKGLRFEKGWFIFPYNGAVDAKYRPSKLVELTANLQRRATDNAKVIE